MAYRLELRKTVSIDWIANVLIIINRRLPILMYNSLAILKNLKIYPDSKLRIRTLVFHPIKHALWIKLICFLAKIQTLSKK